MMDRVKRTSRLTGWLEPSSRAVCGLLMIALVMGVSTLTAQDTQTRQEKQRQEESKDYFQKWLDEVVTYIITPEERDVFNKLTTNEEKESFIEQFWKIRDPDPRTAVNEFKEEHYRRIAYANEHFAAGWPGWQTDRGKVYIIHGPPDEREMYPSGGTYQRPMNEGGGFTATYPFEIWRYRYIEGIGNNVELQFVSRDMNETYRLALTPDEKDAFLHVPNAGFTTAEELGLANRLQRPYFSPAGSYPLMNYRAQDSAFQRYQTIVDVQRPPKLKFPELKQVVDVDLSYEQLPFDLEFSRFRLSQERTLVRVNVVVPHQSLTFSAGANGRQEAKVALYGVVTSMTQETIAEFEDELVASFAPDEYSQGLLRSSVAEKMFVVDSGSRYKVTVVVKDLAGNRVGVASQAINAPERTDLSVSSLILSDYIVPAQENQRDQMFVLGDVVVRPRLSHQFTANDYCALYLQVYNVHLDQSSGQPVFQANYEIVKEGEEKPRVTETDEVGESVQFFSPQRMVLIKRLPLQDLDAGRYRLRFRFQDRIADQKVEASTHFEVVAREGAGRK